MDELFWVRDHEDINDWAECLTTAVEVRDLNDDNMFKITKLNLCSKAKGWFKKLNPPLADWTILRTIIIQKFGDVDVDEICVKLDAIKHEPRKRVEMYFERLDNYFREGGLVMPRKKKDF